MATNTQQVQNQGKTVQADPLLEYERSLLQILSKFGEPHTQAIGNEEINRFMMQEIREHEHMIIFMNKLSESNEHMKLQQKKEYIKIYGRAAQIFEEALIPYLQKILGILQKKCQAGNTDLHGVISDTFGQIAFHIVQKGEGFEQQLELFNQILKVPHQLLIKSTNKVTQSAGAICLSKIIQNADTDLLAETMDHSMDEIIRCLKSNQFRAHAALLESLIAIIFHVEQDFEPFVDRFIPVLLEMIAHPDWATKKVGIDAINSLATTVTDKIIPHRVDILQALKPSRFHKMKPVREAALYTIKLLKETNPPLGEHELAILDDHPQKQPRQNMRDYKSKSPGRQKQPDRSPARGDLKQKPSGGPVMTESRQGSQYQNYMVSQQKNQRSATEVQNEETVVNTYEDQQTNFATGEQLNDLKPHKKVSQATLKRRAKQNDEKAKKRENSPEVKAKERQPLFLSKMNSNFFNQDGKQGEFEIFESKHKQSMQVQNFKIGNHVKMVQEENNQESDNSSSNNAKTTGQRKTKAQRKVAFEQKKRASARDTHSFEEEKKLASMESNEERHPEDLSLIEDHQRNNFNRTLQPKPSPKVQKQKKFASGFDNIQIFESKHKQPKETVEDDVFNENQLKSSPYGDQTFDPSSGSRNKQIQDEESNDQIMWPTKQVSFNPNKEAIRKEFAEQQHANEEEQDYSDNQVEYKENQGFVDQRLLSGSSKQSQRNSISNRDGFADQRISSRFQFQGELQNDAESLSDQENEQQQIGMTQRDGETEQLVGNPKDDMKANTTRQRYSKYSSYDPAAQNEDIQMNYVKVGNELYANHQSKNMRQFQNYRGNEQNEANLGLQHTSAFIERNQWMKNYLPTASGQVMPTNQFNASGTMVLHRNDDIQSKSARDLKLNNYMQQQDDQAIQTLQQTLQGALTQIEQLQQQQQQMVDQITSLQTEKGVMAAKLNNMERMLMQLQLINAQKQNIDDVRAMYDQRTAPGFSNATAANSGTDTNLNTMESIQPQQHHFHQSQLQQVHALLNQHQQSISGQYESNQATLGTPVFNNPVFRLQPSSSVSSFLPAQINASETPYTHASYQTMNEALSRVSSMQSLNTGVAGQPNQPTALQWSVIENLLQRQMYDEAFMMMLRQIQASQQLGVDSSNDGSMTLIKALGKTGAQIVLSISEPVKNALFNQVMKVLAQNDFVDSVLQFLSEAIQNHPSVLSAQLSQSISLQLSQVRENDLQQSLNNNGKLTIQQRETMEQLVKKYRQIN